MKELNIYIKGAIQGWKVEVCDENLNTIVREKLYIYDDLWEVISDLQGQYEGYKIYFNFLKLGEDREYFYNFLDEKDLNYLEKSHYDRLAREEEMIEKAKSNVELSGE